MVYCKGFTKLWRLNNKSFAQRGALLIEFCILLTLAFAFIAVNDLKEPIKEFALNKIEDRNMNGDAYKFGGVPRTSTNSSGGPISGDDVDNPPKPAPSDPIEVGKDTLTYTLEDEYIWTTTNKDEKEYHTHGGLWSGSEKYNYYSNEKRLLFAKSGNYTISFNSPSRSADLDIIHLPYTTSERTMIQIVVYPKNGSPSYTIPAGSYVGIRGFSVTITGPCEIGINIAYAKVFGNEESRINYLLNNYLKITAPR